MLVCKTVQLSHSRGMQNPIDCCTVNYVILWLSWLALRQIGTNMVLASHSEAENQGGKWLWGVIKSKFP